LYLLTHINKAFSKKLPLAVLYQAQTVEELAHVLDNDNLSVSWSSLTPLQTNGSRPPFFWIHGELSDATLPRHLGPDQPVYGLLHQSDDGKPARYKTVESIAAHYLSEIRTIQPKGPYFIGGFCFGGLVAIEIAQQLRAVGDEMAFLVVMDPDILKTCGRSLLPLQNQPDVPSKGARARDNLRRLHQKLDGFDTQQRLTFLGSRVQSKLAQWITSLTFPIKSAICAFCAVFGIALPVSLRSFYILGVYRRATRKYRLKSFPGSLTLFVQSPTDGSPLFWQGLAENVEVHELPPVSHNDILKEPYVRVWAAKLKGLLQRTHARGSQT
jgi:thioesterase domain-containing protein